VTPAPAGSPEAIRLDKWLWHARICKSRAVAARLVAQGAVRVNAVPVTKPAAPVRAGDGLSFAHGGKIRVLRVLGLGARRGPAAEARLLYADLEAADGAPAALEPAGQADT
jgi:ribosome-associated heat shock protein Hsp15